MNRRQFVGAGVLGGLSGALKPRRALGAGSMADCGCAALMAPPQLPVAPGRLKVTGMKVFGVTIERTKSRSRGHQTEIGRMARK
jgi:hypothetical protein